MKILNELKSRGVEDVLIFSVDGLAGISKAINNVYPQADVQRCIVHQVRVFSSDESLLKSLYIVAVELERKWSRKPIAGWVEYMDNFLFYLRVGFRLW